MPRLSKKQKQEWDFFINPKTGRTSLAENVITIANKVIVSLLFTAANSRQKGA